MTAGSSALILMSLLISGYLFNLIFHPFRYFSSRAEGQKLFFMAAGTGLVLGAVIFAVTGMARPWLDSHSWVLKVAHSLDAAIPIPYACRLLLTIAASVLLSGLLNFLSVQLVRGRRSEKVHANGGSRSRAQCVYDRLTEQYGSPMAQLFRRAADRQKLVMITLRSRKIYCGRVFEVPPDIDFPDACIEVLPSFSACRDKDNLRMGESRTDYPVIDLWVARQRVYSLEEQIKLFDLEVKERFQAQVRDPIGKKFFRRTKRMLEAELSEARQLVDNVSGGRDFDVSDWIKVIPIREIESASFYDSEAYKAWFSGGDSSHSSDLMRQAACVEDVNDRIGKSL